MDLMVITGIVLALMETIMASVGLLVMCWGDVIWRMGTNSTPLNPTGIQPKNTLQKEFCNGFNGRQLMDRNGFCNGNH